MITRLKRALVAAIALGTLVAMAGCDVQTNASSPASSSGVAKALKIGWSTIYLTPSWMQETQKLMATDISQLKSQGTVADYEVFNANGDTSQQIAQIRAMIQQKYNAIIVDAGSSTALNPALEQAVGAGIAVVNFDSLVTSDEVIKVGTDQQEWGRMTAQWLADKLGGKGQIIAFNGPAGVSVSEDRWAGAESVFQKYPGIQVVSTLNSEYNVAPAAQAFAAAYAAHPAINGVFAQGGALADAALQTILSQNGKLVPITGENYNGFLKLWQAQQKNGFSSLSTAQPNYLGVIAIDAAVAKIEGTKVPANITVPLPQITDANLAQYVQDSQPDDYYPINSIPQSQIDQLIGK